VCKTRRGTKKERKTAVWRSALGENGRAEKEQHQEKFAADTVGREGGRLPKLVTKADTEGQRSGRAVALSNPSTKKQPGKGTLGDGASVSLKKSLMRGKLKGGGIKAP